MRDYRCEATTVTGFIQQLAVSYVARGYFLYVTGKIPERKDPRGVDERIIAKYGLEIGKTSRARRKAVGLANVQYLRYGRSFVLVATEGHHPVFAQEAGIRDVRLGVPMKFGGYAISHRGGHVHVRIERNRYLNLTAQWVDMAVHRRKEWFEEGFKRLPFEPYAPVRGQLFGLLRKINERRVSAQFEPVSSACIRVWRRKVKPFAELSCASDIPQTPGTVVSDVSMATPEDEICRAA